MLQLALTTVGILKRESISSLFVSVPNKVKNKLLEHLKTKEKDIVFKAYSGEEGETNSESNFPNFDDKKQATIRFAISTKDTNSLTEDTDKKQQMN